MLYTLENEFISIAVDTHGAELKSLVNKATGAEYMWCADPRFWNRTSPVLFPFVGKLNNTSYTHNGLQYTGVPQHGWARDTAFAQTVKTDDTMWFTMQQDSTWRQNYPFDFTFAVGYQLKGKTVNVMWQVMNKAGEEMHFSIGAHPAFACQGGYDYWLLDFGNGTATLSSGTLCSAGTLTDEVRTLQLNNGLLELNTDIFDRDAYILDGADISTVTLLTPQRQRVLAVHFDAPQLGIWSKPGNAPFVCIEPWWGRCDRQGYAGDLAHREYGNTLPAHQTFKTGYSIEIL